MVKTAIWLFTEIPITQSNSLNAYLHFTELTANHLFLFVLDKDRSAAEVGLLQTSGNIKVVPLPS